MTPTGNNTQARAQFADAGSRCVCSERSYQFFRYNQGQNVYDSAILHCMLRHFKPNTVIEVGSGYSTMLSAAALTRNDRELGPRCEAVIQAR